MNLEVITTENVIKWLEKEIKENPDTPIDIEDPET